MFMEPIEFATVALAPAPRERPAALKLAVGLIFLAVCTVLMLPWAVLMAGWFAVAAGARAVARAIREMRVILNFSG